MMTTKADQLAGQIAAKVDPRWCGWHRHIGCARYRVATHTGPDDKGNRNWREIGLVSFEHLELLLTLGPIKRSRSISRIVKALKLRRQDA